MATWYVEPTAPAGTVGGNTWASAGDLDATLTAVLATPSRGGDEIWCKQGTYSLATPLVINNNTEPLSIYGSFDGWETYLCQRNAKIGSTQYSTNFFQNPSILDGGGAGGNRVIDMQQANVCRIDGFIIQNGNAGNSAGGGMLADGRNLWFENLVFMDNEAQNGGGMFAGGGFNLMIKNSIFFRNRATFGGGLYVKSYNKDDVFLVNLLFNDNQPLGTAGNGNAIYVESDAKIINNTISGNIGTATSSDVYCSFGNVGIYNSIIYPDSLMAIGGLPFLTVRVDYCLLNNLIPFTIPPFNNPNGLPLGTNPNFVTPIPPIPPPPLSAGGDYHLQAGSLCIDSGNSGYIFPYSATDLEGEPRFINGGVATTPPSIVDMGAFEWQ
jgi:hypothetical protein